MSLAVVVWLARDMWHSDRNPASDRLNELMQTTPGERRSPTQQTPPQQIAWASPMAMACPQQQPALQQRLRTLRPRLRRIRTDPSNYGERFQRDHYGNRVDPTPRVVVLHETVYGLQSAISTFMTPHPNDDDQVSYHSLIGRDGEIVQVVDPSKRAFGAGNSAFRGEWVVTNPAMSGSINNFALHLSLETPPDGENSGSTHSGYSEAQYDSMALLLENWIRTYRIPLENITTHRHVDLGGERADPRSFNWETLRQRLVALGVAGC